MVYYTPDGFYFEGQTIPANAVAITEAEYQALLLAAEQGKSIQPDATGKPVAV